MIGTTSISRVMMGAALLAAAAASGCGTDDAKQALDPVAQAAEATDQQTGGIALTVNTSISSGDKKVTATGEGVVDREGKTGKLTLRARSGDDTTTIREVIRGNVLYIQSDDLEGRLPSGKTWLKVDLDAAARKEGVDLDALDSLGSDDPADTLDFLKAAGDSKRVGTETIRGIETTRYHVDVDLEKLSAESGSASAKRSVKNLIKATGSDTIPLDVWIDDKHLVRREREEVTVRKNGNEVKTVTTTELVRFGVAFKSKVPDAEDTADALKLLEKQKADSTTGKRS